MPPHSHGLAKYTGPLFELHARLGAPHSSDSFGADHTGHVEYRFNALGYRGPDFQPDAAFRVFVFGESDAFGAGIDFEDAWPMRVARAVARRRSIADDQVGISCFAHGGHSNAAIARSLFTQCGRVHPDLVLIEVADPQRGEGHIDGTTFNIGPWNLTEVSKHQLRAIPKRNPNYPLARERYLRGKLFMRSLTPSRGWLDSVQNLLAMQFFLRSEGIPGVALSRAEHSLYTNPYAGDPVLEPLIKMIDRDFYRAFAPIDENTADRANDHRHFGPAVHATLAGQALDLLGGPGTAERPAIR